MASFGPTPNAAQYGENLKKQRGPGPVADRTQAYQPDPIEEDSDLVKGLKVLGRQSSINNLGPATGKNVPAEKKKVTAAGAMVAPGTSIELAQQAAANTTPIGKETGHPWVTEDPQPLPFDENGMLNGQTAMPFADHVPNVPQNLGVSFDRTKELTGVTDGVTPPEEAPLPPVEAPVEVVDQNNMPETVIIDPSASGLSKYIAQASSTDIDEAKAAAAPQNQPILEEKAATGQEMSLGEKIAWVAMMVAPVALGYALRGEKGAYLGGAAAGKGMESAGKSMVEQEEASQKAASELALQEKKKQSALEVQALKNEKGGENELKRAGIVGLQNGLPTYMNIHGESATPVLDQNGAPIIAPQKDPVTGDFLPQPAPVVTKGKQIATGQQQLEVPQPKPIEEPTAKKNYPKAEKESIKAKMDRLGIATDQFDPDLLQMDDTQLNASQRFGKENANDVETRKKQYAKMQEVIKATEDRNLALKDFSTKQGIEKAGAQSKEARDRLQQQYDASNPWKINKVAITQADYRQAAANAKAEMLDATAPTWTDPKTGTMYKSDPYKGMKQSSAQGIDDIGLLYTFIKMIDPGSVVREGEVHLASAATPLSGRISNMYANLFQGGAALTDDQRKYINGLISAKVVGTYADQMRHEAAYKAMADELGVDFRLVQDPLIAVEMKDMAKAQRLAKGIKTFKKSDDASMLSKLPKDTAFLIDNEDGTFTPMTTYQGDKGSIKIMRL